MTLCTLKAALCTSLLYISSIKNSDVDDDDNTSFDPEKCQRKIGGRKAVVGNFGETLNSDAIWRTNVAIGAVHGHLRWYTYAIERAWMKEKTEYNLYRAQIERNTKNHPNFNMFYQYVKSLKMSERDKEDSIARIGLAYERKKTSGGTEFSWVVEASNLHASF